MAESPGKYCYHAIERGDLAGVRKLLDRGLPIDDRFADYGGRSPLTSAAYHGQLNIMRELLARGADPIGIGYANGTGIILAACEGRTDPIRLLAERGADVNFAKPTSGETALHWAAFNNAHDYVVHTLLSLGADANARTHTGLGDDQIIEDGETFVEQGAMSALHFAAWGKKSCPVGVVAALLGRGADAEWRTASKRSGGARPGEIRTYLPITGETAREWVLNQCRFPYARQYDAEKVLKLL